MIIYDFKPSVYEETGDGRSLYRWDIEQIEMPSDMSGDNVIKWSCNEVAVYATVTIDKVVENVINSLWGNGVEQKLINDYNSASLGLLDESYIQKYKDFLKQRNDIKTQINNDLKDILTKRI